MSRPLIILILLFPLTLVAQYNPYLHYQQQQMMQQQQQQMMQQRQQIMSQQQQMMEQSRLSMMQSNQQSIDNMYVKHQKRERLSDADININGVAYKMVMVEGGNYTTNDGKKVAYADLYFGQTEVTQALWSAVMGEGWKENVSKLAVNLGPDYPVCGMDREKIDEFIARLNALTGRNYRLPLTREWYYAFHGGSDREIMAYAGTNDPDQAGWYAGNTDKTVQKVAQKMPNRAGLYDMSGNVSELCGDPIDDIDGLKRIYTLGGNVWQDREEFKESNYMLSHIRELAVGIGPVGLRLVCDAYKTTPRSTAPTALSEGNFGPSLQKCLEWVTFNYDDGSLYKGMNYQNERSGLGVYLSTDGYLQAGAFHSDVQSGYGIYMFLPSTGKTLAAISGAMIYVGNFAGGDFTGRGSCYDRYGNLLYHGQFSGDEPTESIQQYWDDTYRFECIDYRSGDRYLGETKDGVKYGKGIYFWQNGDMWYGSWRDDKRQGYGVYIPFNGMPVPGNWIGDIKTL